MTEPAATTLVVIDDDPDVLRATVRVLRQAGYNVVTGESAAQALELTWRLRPAILLLDVMLPDGNGVDVARQLKSEPALASVFIILLSGLKTSGEDQADGLGAGLVDGYIALPFNKPEFLARIDAMLRLRAEQESLREALSQIRMIASLVPGLICQYRLRPDGSSCFPFASKVISEIFRVSPEEVSQDATAVFALLHPEDHDQTIASIRASAKNLSPWRHEFRMKFSDGTVRRLFGNGIPQAESSGGVLWHCFIMDISERKQLETALRESEESFKLMFHEAPLGIALIDSLNGKFLMVNPMFAKLAGRSMDEMANIDWMSITHPDDLPADVMQFERVLRGEIDGYALDKRYLRKDGSVIPVFLSMRCVRKADGSVDYFVALFQDITERKRAEEAIRTLNATLEQRVVQRTAELDATVRDLTTEIARRNQVEQALRAANQELETFSYSISHDLRAPLRSISGFSSMLEEEYAAHLDEDGKDKLRRMRQAAQRMGELIEELLSLSRLTGRAMNAETVDLSALARSVAEELKGADPGRSVTFEIAPKLEVRGDKRLLAAAIENLLANAWKFTGKHTSARIEFGATQKDGKPAYFVRDDGAGFNMAEAANLFTPFHRMHSDNDFAGHGIGLATVQRIVQRHGGHIWADSAVEKGATFYFTLSH